MGSTLMSRRIRDVKAATAMSLAAFLFLCLGPYSEPAHGQVVALAGKLDVAPTGAATYTVPITVPPGTAGMVPALTLQYSSEADDGIVGLGWSLSGLPSIGHCVQTLADDGVHGNINFDSSDRFCIEGQRLSLISGTYGADGSQYRTEIESFSEIIAHGQAGNGPAWFEVHSKSGQIMQLGNTSDSQLLAQGQATVRSWAVNKISDTKGNYLTVKYTNDTTNGQAYPTEIDYTANDGAGLAAYDSVKFVYNTSRPDIIPHYQAGSLMQNTVLLTSIQTYASGALVGSYNLTYELGTPTRTSRLISIAQCDGSSPQQCLPATTFGWEGTRDDFSFTAVPNNLLVSLANATYGLPVAGDFNGDGLTDFLSWNDQNATQNFSQASCATTYLGSQSGSFSPTTPYCPSGGNITAANVGDLTGTAITDAVLHVTYDNGPGNGTSTLLSALGGSSGALTPGATIYSATCGNNDNCPTLTADLADMNGDGRDDVIVVFSTYDLLLGGSTFGPFTSGGNFDGSGCFDYLTFTNSNPNNPYAIITNYSCSSITSLAGTMPTSMALASSLIGGDFLGDGKTDFFGYSSTAAQGTVWLSTGNGWVQGPTANNWPAGGPFFPGNFTGDGKTGLAEITGGPSGQIDFFISSGTALVQAATTISLSPVSCNAGSVATIAAIPADWNNDGATDLWVLQGCVPSPNTLDLPTTWISATQYLSNYVPNLLTTITTGLGSTATITYDRLNHGTIYTEDTSDTYPTVDIGGPMYVVSEIDASNGVGGNYTSTYSYAGAKSDATGRGFLGFRQMSVTDKQTNVVQTTNYLQSFPFIGLIASKTKTLGSQTLNSTTNSYALTNASGGNTLGSPQESAAPYQVSLQQTVETSSDLDGSAMPTVTTTYQYDSFGNPTQVVVSTSDGYTKSTENTYTNDTTHWFLGRLTNATNTSTIP